jgi:hypothetical protein
LAPRRPRPAASVGIASQNPSFERISGPVSWAPTMTGRLRPDQRRGVQALAGLRVGLAPDRVRQPPAEPRAGDLAAPGGLQPGAGLAHGGGDGLLAGLHLGGHGNDEIRA